MSDQQEPAIPENIKQDLYDLHIEALKEARDASHRLANRLHEATLSLQVAKTALRQRRLQRFLTYALLVFTSVYLSISLLDGHVEGCAVLGRPKPGQVTKIGPFGVETVKLCNITFPWHDHQRERRLVEEPFLRHQIEEVVRDVLRKEDR